MKRFDLSWVAQMHCPIPQSLKSIKTPMDKGDWSKNRNKACKIKAKIIQHSQDNKRSETKSTSQKLQVSIANGNQMIKACIKEHHTRSLTWWRGMRDQTKVYSSSEISSRTLREPMTLIKSETNLKVRWD